MLYFPKSILSVLSFLFLLFSATAVSAATPEKIFEIDFATNRSSAWGIDSPTYLNRIAQSYSPEENHSICSVDHRITQFGGASDDVSLNIYAGNLENAEVVASSTLSSASLWNPFLQYVNFDLGGCFDLSSTETYFFVFARSAPTVSSGYISGFRSSTAQYSYSKSWQFNNFLPYGWQSKREDWSLRLNGFFAKEPVIIVPGLLGTRLNRALDGVEVWPNTDKMAFPRDEYLDELKLDSSGGADSGVSIKSGELVDKAGIRDFYGPIIKGLKEDYRVFLLPYDWRKDLNSEIFRLEDVIKEAVLESPSGKVNIVAHSMGGLLVKEYLRMSGDSDLINNLVFLGVPQLGAPKAFKALNYGDNFDIFPLSEERMKIISQNMPGAYQLLPSEEYFQVNGSYVRDFRNGKVENLNYLQTTAFLTEDPDDSRNQFLINQAKDFRDLLDPFSAPVENTYNIVGCNKATVGGFYLYDNGKIDLRFVNGDGTVPLTSSLYQSKDEKTYYSKKQNHRELVAEENPLSIITQILNGEEVVLPSGISDELVVCKKDFSKDEEEIVVSTHSPVVFHVYDEFGNHTGPLPNGDLEFGIPESEYFSLGENNFAVIPKGTNYRTVVQAYALGSFDLKIKEYSGGELVGARNYLEIPIASEKLQAEITFSGIDSAESLAVDVEGDGQMDFGVEPFVLSGDVSDVTPPEVLITAPTLPLLHSEVFLPKISVEDSASGVASINVFWDERKLEAESVDLFFEEPGSHLLTVKAYDVAGNLRIATSSVEVIATVDSTIADLERINNLEWIKRRAVFVDLRQRLRNAVRVAKRIDVLESRDRQGRKILKRIERLEKRFDTILMTRFKNALTKYKDRGMITEEAFTILQKNIDFVLQADN